jgi:hypothetical protein
MHHILLHLTLCIIFFLAHLCSYILDHTKPELEVRMEQAQADDLTNLDLDHGKLRCIKPCFLSFKFKSYFMF